MNDLNNKVNGNKSQPTSSAHSFDGGIADALIIDCPYSKVRVERKGLDDQAYMRAAQLRGVLFGMQAAEDGDELLALAYELSADTRLGIGRPVVKCVRQP